MLKAARMELESARRAIQGMREASSFEEYEAEWRACLNCLEKVWVKAERACQPIKSKFQPWQGKFQSLRRKDMLLKYLKQARDADNHSIQDVVKHEPGGYEIKMLNGSGYIRSLDVRDGVIHYDGDPAEFILRPRRIEVLKVLNSGSWYNPPVMHLDARITTRDPVALAELGLGFYEDFVRQTEEKFSLLPEG